MTNLERTISEVKEDLKPLDVPKDIYLALCVKNRLTEQSKKYDKKFDEFIRNIECQSLCESDLTKMTSYIMSFSKALNKMYDKLVRNFEVFQNYVNRRTTASYDRHN